MKIGVALPHYDFSFPHGGPATVERVVGYARRMEEAGFDSVWVSDHLFLDLGKYGGPPDRFGTPEAVTMLDAIAMGTSRVEMGPLVLCVPFRNPVVLAKQVEGLVELGGGRLVLGLGAGWYEAEFAAAGIPFETTGRRMEAVAGTARALRGAMGDRTPPVWIGGKGGPRLMRLVAAVADGWNVVWRMTPDAYRTRLDALRAACDEAGRDPSAIGLSVGLACLVGADETDLEKRFERLRAWTPGGALDAASLSSYAAGGLVGTPERCAERIREFEALGVEHVILSPASVPFSVYEDEQIDLVASELLPLVR